MKNPLWLVVPLVRQTSIGHRNLKDNQQFKAYVTVRKALASLIYDIYNFLGMVSASRVVLEDPPMTKTSRGFRYRNLHNHVALWWTNLLCLRHTDGFEVINPCSGIGLGPIEVARGCVKADVVRQRS